MKDFDWEEVYVFWDYFASELPLAEDELAAFQDIYVELLPYDLIRFGVDWWPKTDIQQRSVALVEDGPYLSYWETRKGTLHTAQELYKSQGNIEQQAAIWIMASIWDKQHKLPAKWRGDTFSLLEKLFYTIRIAFPDVSIWHHAARGALPLSIGQYYPASDFIHPHTFQEVVYLSLLEASLILAHWQLVRFVPSKTA